MARVTAYAIVVAWWFAVRQIWWPLGRLIRRVRAYLGRHEIWTWLATWGVCAGFGWLLASNLVGSDLFRSGYFKLAGGIVAAVTFTLVSIASPFTGLSIWLLVSPLLNRLINFKFLPGTPVVTGDRVCVIILVAVFLIHIKERSKIERTPLLHASMFAFIGAMLLAVLPADKIKDAAQLVMDTYLAPIVAYFLARRWVTSEKALRIVFVIMIVVGFYFSAFAIPEHFTGRLIFGRINQAWIEDELGTVRVQGPAESPSEFGLIAIGALVLALTKFATEDNRRNRLLLGITMIALLVGIGFTLRRSVFLAAGLGLLVMLGASAKPRRFVAVALAVSGFALFLNWQGFSQSKVYQSRISDVRPIYQRAILYSTSWNIVKNHPWLGVGVGKFPEARAKYLAPYGDIPAWYGKDLPCSHNSYLTILTDGGLVALVPFVALLWLMITTTYRAYRHAGPRGLAGRDGIVAFWAITAGVLAQAFTEDQFRFCHYLSMFWFCYFGAIVGVHLRKEDPVPELAPKKRESFPSRRIRNGAQAVRRQL